MEERAHHQCDRAAARGVQATDQDADRAAFRRNRCNVVLGFVASGQINMRKVDGWKTLAAKSIAQLIDLVA
jgi:hypothetical protein